MSLSSVRSETALRSRLFSSSRSFRRFTCSVFSPPNFTSLTPIWRIASTMFWPCETRTSTCRNFATISSGLYRFLAITVLLDVKDIPQVGPLQWGSIKLSLAGAVYPSNLVTFCNRPPRPQQEQDLLCRVGGSPPCLTCPAGRFLKPTCLADEQGSSPMG